MKSNDKNSKEYPKSCKECFNWQDTAKASPPSLSGEQKVACGDKDCPNHPHRNKKWIR